MAITRAGALIALLGTFVLSGLAYADPPIEVPEDQPTIQAAVDAANPGDKILIGPGVYNESIVVDVDRVRLIAREGLHTVVVDGTGLGDPVTGVDGIHVIADGVELRDLVVRNFAEFVGAGVVAFRVGILSRAARIAASGATSPIPTVTGSS